MRKNELHPELQDSRAVDYARKLMPNGDSPQRKYQEAHHEDRALTE